MTASKFLNFFNSIKSELRLDCFSLSFEKNVKYQKDPEEVLECFHSCMWPFVNRLVYLIYRIGIAVYYSIWFVESIVRNYEFRAKNLKILTGETKKSLLLHPWPFYMTSWSLTLLFIHLWLSAFIVLYFYSIEKKSCLSSVFSFLFGPFSCSRSNQQQLENTSTNSANTSINNESFITKITKCFKSRSKSQPSLQLDKNTNNEILQESLISKKTNDNEIIIINMTSSSNLNVEKVENSLADPSTNHDERLEKTYCSNKSKCQLPSSKIMSDAASWQLWIDVR